MYRQDAAPDRTILVTAFNSQLFGIDRATGQVRWTVSEILGYGLFEIAIEHDVVIVASPVNLGFVEYLTGKILAVVPIGGEYPGRPTMLVDNGFVYIGRQGELTCFTTRGQKVWQEPFKGKGMSTMALGLPGNVRQADDPGAR